MPALSPTMETGTLAKWLIAVGDSVRAGDVIAEIETDKATMEVEAVEEGVLAAITVDAGSENIAVGAVIAILAEEGDDMAKLATTAPSTDTPSLDTPAPDVPAPDTPAPDVPAPDMPAGDVQGKGTAVAPLSAPSQVPPADVRAGPVSDRIFASPLARRIATDKGVNLGSLTGSGPHGRILRRDVEAVKAPVGAAQTPGQGGDAPQAGASTVVPNNQMRKIIAARLQESKQTAPHFYLTMDCDIGALVAARKSLNAMADEGIKISLNDLVIRAAAMALIKVPAANASWEGDHTRLFHNADICMAVAVEGGLVTPVIWAAEQKGLADLSKITKDLATRARAAALDPAEYTGGSFTISNLGMFGVREFAAVINPPQGAILAVGAGEERAVVRDGALSVATMMTVTLSCDHRAVDGAVGAQWLQAFKSFIENPVTMLL
jgi:pyruvate dehydrogenase E2 component (dihydrolipoamide acetyltransferase)